MAPLLKLRLNSYFQTAIADPTRKLATLKERVYRSASHSTTLSPPMSGTMKVTVGSDPSNRRTWVLSKSLLARHSKYIANIIKQDSEEEEVFIIDLEPGEFQNFVDYMYSSIYSLNTHVTGYRATMDNAMACLLGEKLSAKEYSDAAMRQLYMIFQPLARLRTSNARKSSIKASDIEYICRNTVPHSSTLQQRSGIRKLFFDAVASHWTQVDILNIQAMDTATPNDTVSWFDVYKKYSDFRIMLTSSLKIADVWRTAILRPVDEYINPVFEWTDIRREQADGSSDGQLDGSTGERGRRSRVIAYPRPRIPATRRRSSSDRQMREMTDALEEDLIKARRFYENKDRGEAVVKQEQENGW